jgi:hypothetical protein
MPAAALTAMRALSLEHPMATPPGSFIAGVVRMRTLFEVIALQLAFSVLRCRR